MATPIVQQEGTAYHFEPLKTVRLCRDEVAALRMELERTEKLSRYDAEREAVQMLAELREYADDWDALVYKAGNPIGLPF